MLRMIVKIASVMASVATVSALGAGCLDRPVTKLGATTKTNFTAQVTSNAIDKVDILFDIDNSASMGDKQAYLALAVPDLITRLVQPNCVVPVVGSMTGQTMTVGQSTNGSCAAFAGSSIEFPPVHNMHIGIISSSLGNRGPTGLGQEVCDPTEVTGTLGNGKTLPAHTDDSAHLLTRTPAGLVGPVVVPLTQQETDTEGTSPDTQGQGFLDWFPTGANWTINNGKTPTSDNANPSFAPVLKPTATDIMTASQLEDDFSQLVVGSHYYGCGIESQLESWYRFLIQPDPYGEITTYNGSATNPNCGANTVCATWGSSVDPLIIQQRHDFLRPDSLVAIIDLTDENDSEIDVRSFGGQAFQFMNQSFKPPRGTAACATNPNSPQCTNCDYPGHGSDPSCMMNGGVFSAPNDWGFYINVRHVHMKAKYGIDPQFPLGRYVLGLTSPTVPDRFHEYPESASGTSPCYQGGIFDSNCNPLTAVDTSKLDCTNPLFAATLPDGSDLSEAALCNANGAGGTRTPGLIFYAHIGGVPHELLQTTPGDSTGLCSKATAPQDCPQKDVLLPADWAKILGQGWGTLTMSSPALENPNAYNYNGISPYMIEDYTFRPGILQLMNGPGPTGGSTDTVNGGDWATDQGAHVLPVDREYACIFPLVDPTSGTPTPRDCTLTDYETTEACDCTIAGLPKNAVPSVCGLSNSGAPYAMGTNDYQKQYYAKTYPTIREIQLAELMGQQGILSSLCPIHPAYVGGTGDPLFGYRPAITAIVNRLKNALSTQCLPEKLAPAPTTMGVKTCTDPNAKCEVECLILATLAPVGANAIKNESSVCNDPKSGLSVATGDQVQIVQSFQQSQHAAWKAANHPTEPDLSTFATCIVNQVPYNKMSSCAKTNTTPGWCYVDDAADVGSCSQAIQFTPGSPPQGAIVSLQCIEANVNPVSADDAGSE